MVFPPKRSKDLGTGCGARRAGIQGSINFTIPLPFANFYMHMYLYNVESQNRSSMKEDESTLLVSLLISRLFLLVGSAYIIIMHCFSSTWVVSF